MGIIYRSPVAVAHPSKLPLEIPGIPGALHDFDAGSIALDPGQTVTTGAWASLTGSGALTVLGAPKVGRASDGRAWVETTTDGAIDHLYISQARAMPHTVVAVVEHTTPVTGMSAILGNGSNLWGTVFTMNSTTGVYRAYDGTPLEITGRPHLIGQRFIVIAVFNGPGSVISVDGHEVTGDAGTDGTGTPWFSLGRAGVSYAKLRYYRAALIPEAIDADARRKLVAQMRARFTL